MVGDIRIVESVSTAILAIRIYKRTGFPVRAVLKSLEAIQTITENAPIFVDAYIDEVKMHDADYQIPEWADENWILYDGLDCVLTGSAWLIC